MRGRIPEETIREIRERCDIVQVVSSYLPLKRSGVNHQGLCPFHSEKTPSFNVNAARQIFHCFGCGVGGNVFSFVMRMEGLAFPEAVRRLGEQVGIQVAEDAPDPAELRRREARERLVRISEAACDFYHRILLEEADGAPGRRYLRERGYDGETARHFRLGFAPGRWDGLTRLLQQQGFDLREVKELGLIRSREKAAGEYDLFRQRLIFPITGIDGRVVAFGGRVLDDALPKYINSPESPLYHKGRILYGLSQAREEMRRYEEVVVVEGYFDLLALQRAGFSRVVATCGTALTEEHGRLLQRYAKKVLLLFDQDKAGQKATFRAMETLLPLGLSLAVVSLDQGEDPDSFLHKQGEAAFTARLQEARSALDVYLEAELAAQGDSIEGQALATEEILRFLALVPSEIERSLYLQHLARQTGLTPELLQQRLRRSQHPSREVAPVPAAPAARPPAVKGKETKAQEMLLRLMIEDERVRTAVAEEGVNSLFFDASRQAIAGQILAAVGDDGNIIESMLFDRLNEEQKAILSGILVRDEQAFAEERQRIVQDCRQTVRKENLKRRIRELDQQMQAAEQAGDRQRLAVLQVERLQVCRELKK
ncbi:MAG: DNA primase [Desulfuromonadaceae bacterium]